MKSVHPAVEPHEQELLALYERLRTLASDPALAPCVAANTRVAVAALWNIVSDLGIRYEQILDADT